MATKEYRYVTSKKVREKQSNIHVKEMIQVLKNEKITTNLYVKAVKLSAHAFGRFQELFSVTSEATANKMVKEMLKRATRIGAVLAYDGRVNVLFAVDQTAIFLSPDLKTVVTVNKYKKDKVGYKPIVKKKNLSRDKVIDLHFKYINEMESQEEEYQKKMLSIESDVSEAVSMYENILIHGKGYQRKLEIKKMIAEQNLRLKKEGWKLFNLKVEKRHVCKSLASML